MISTFRKIICLLSVLSFVPFVFSIRCWECRSNYESQCADPFDNTTIAIRDCATALPRIPVELPRICRKQIVRENGKDVVIRGCAIDNKHSPACPSPSYGPNGNISCVTCNDKDGCNGASVTGMNIVILLSPLCLMLFK